MVSIMRSEIEFIIQFNQKCSYPGTAYCVQIELVRVQRPRKLNELRKFLDEFHVDYFRSKCLKKYEEVILIHDSGQ